MKKKPAKRATKARPAKRAPKQNYKNPTGATHGTVAHLRKVDRELASLTERVEALERYATPREGASAAQATGIGQGEYPQTSQRMDAHSSQKTSA